MAKVRNYSTSGCNCVGACTCGHTQGISIQVLPGQGGARGTQGVQGAQGVQGVQGYGYAQLQGAQGTQGAIGAGTQGAQGPIGPGGGAQGTQGVQGTIGTQGALGTQGAQGLTGAGTQGVQGSQGEPGTQGISGSSLGTTDDLSEGITNLYFTPERVSYNHVQGVASATWTIVHNLHFYPNVTVQDSAGNIVEGEITYTNSDSLTVTFSTAFSGEAYLS